MSSKTIVEIKGFPELQRKIQQLGNSKDKKKEVLNILRQVAKSTVNAARGFAPVSKKSHIARGKRIESGTLKRSIGTITGRKGNAKENPIVYVGPRVRGRYKGWYGHFVEAGHNVYRKGFVRKNRKGGSTKRYRHKAVNFVEGKHYMKRAYRATGGRVTKESEKRIARFIQRRINKLSN